MIAASAQGATRLLEALEKLAQWAGEPSGGGSSGAPSRELVRAFEEALSLPPADASAAAAGGTGGAPRNPCRALPLPEQARRDRRLLWNRPGRDLPWSGPPQPVALMSPPGRR